MSSANDPARAAYNFAFNQLQAGHSHSQIIRILIDQDFDPELAVAIVSQARRDLEMRRAEQQRNAEIWLQNRTAALFNEGRSHSQAVAQLHSEGVPEDVARNAVHDVYATLTAANNRKRQGKLVIGGVFATGLALVLLFVGYGLGVQNSSTNSPVVAVAQVPTSDIQAVADLPTTESTATARPTRTPRPTSTPRPTRTPLPTATPLPQIAVQSEQLNVREGPSSEKYAVITTVPNGSSFNVVGRGFTSSPWVQVDLGDRTGWVYAPFTNLDEEVFNELPLRGWYPSTGVLQGDANLQGGGLVELINQGEQDIVVALTIEGQSPIAVYVRSGDTVEVQGIPYGVYTLYTSSGRDWNGREFITADYFGRDNEPLVFNRETDAWTLTYGVVNGNSSSSSISSDEFPPILTESTGE
jgi:hypothetical protein